MMSPRHIAYLTFGIILFGALIFDLGLLSRKNKIITIKNALLQTSFWVFLALDFFMCMWLENGHRPAFEYLSAYLMEWSLSIDNIFVFILIFNAFKVKSKNYPRVLFIGILMAIIFRIVFITAGVALVQQFHWILYLFGAFLIYTGYKMFTTEEKNEFDPKENKVYLFLRKFLPLAMHDGNGRFIIKENGKVVYTTLFVVIVMLASIDLVFALDSIPAVLGISTDPLVIYTSNIFAVLGLRSLFFLLRSAVDKFDYLQQGIAIVLVFIGLKMLGEHWIDKWLSSNAQLFISLGMIVLCISVSILYSIYKIKNAPVKL